MIANIAKGGRESVPGKRLLVLKDPVGTHNTLKHLREHNLPLILLTGKDAAQRAS